MYKYKLLEQKTKTKTKKQKKPTKQTFVSRLA